MTINENKEPIRVLMLFTILNRGGAETMTMNYYRNIDRTRVQFDFVVHREEKGVFEDEIRALGGRIFRMMPLRPHKFGVYKRQISKFFDEHPEYKIIHGQCSESGYFFYKEASRRGIPVIIAHAHSSHVTFDLKLLVRTWMKHKMRPYLTNCFSCGNEAAEWLFGKALASNAIILKNAIDTTLYRFDPSLRKTKRESLGFDDNAFVVCHVGSFVKVKNHDFIIDMFDEIMRKNSNAMLMLVGEGQLKDSIEQKVRNMHLDNHVKFLGTRNDVYELLQAADTFILPSHFEGMPMSLIEAQCSGLSCIVSSIIPQEVILTDLVKQLPLEQSPKEWAEKINATTFRHYDRQKYATVIAQAGYDIKSNAKWLEQFYLEAINK